MRWHGHLKKCRLGSHAMAGQPTATSQTSASLPGETDLCSLLPAADEAGLRPRFSRRPLAPFPTWHTCHWGNAWAWQGLVWGGKVSRRGSRARGQEGKVAKGGGGAEEEAIPHLTEAGAGSGVIRVGLAFG